MFRPSAAVPESAHRLTPAAKIARHREPAIGGVVVLEDQVGLFKDPRHRRIAIAIRSDGRRVQVPAEDLGLVDVSLLGLLRTLEFGIGRVFGLITGSRRETGRRD